MTIVRAIAAGLVIAAACGFVGCSTLEPFPAAPQAAASGVTDAGPRVAICYDPVISSTTAIDRAAQEQCAPNTHARRVATDWKLDLCPVFLPTHATFVCAAAK